MFVSTLLQFSQIAILARFLTPEQFGLMALITIVIGFSQAFVDMGMSNAIIHKQTTSTLHLSSLFWATVGMGILTTAIVYNLAPKIANFYSEPELVPLIQLVSMAFVVSSLGSQHKVLFQKDLQFKCIAFVELTSVLCSFSVAILLAWYGAGVYSLVLANIAMTTISSLLFFTVGVRNIYLPKLHLKWSEVAEYFEFGLYQMGERIVNYFSANIDKILIGKFLGTNPVGLYNVSWQLIIFPLSKLNPVVNKVALPIYGKVQKDIEVIDEYYSLAMNVIGIIVIPFSVYFLFFANSVVEVVFGKSWVHAAPLVSILGVVGLLKALGNPGGALLLANGHAKIGFWWNVVWAASLLVSIFLSLSIRPEVSTVAYTLLILSILFCAAWHFLVYRTIAVNYGPIVKTISVLFALSMSACLFSKLVLCIFDVNEPLFTVLLSTLLCALVYCTSVYFLGFLPKYSIKSKEV
ncbi:colanic acid exporter [Vibrio sinaloensis DSM 21326]|uniref:Colanic acid exporter n=2 Tax=Photobacterium sp. (strain ATCC 43367) TaxID=379097 RepID=E8M580_PHOS4|nr:colanic acid exporter [Vibrio sinaloensis DSM 21326]